MNRFILTLSIFVVLSSCDKTKVESHYEFDFWWRTRSTATTSTFGTTTPTVPTTTTTTATTTATSSTSTPIPTTTTPTPTTTSALPSTTTSTTATTSEAKKTTTTPTPGASKSTAPPVYKLSKKTRQALRGSIRGATPEQRKKKLRQIGRKVKIDQIPKNQSIVLHKSYPKVKVNENPPALDLFEVNERAGLNDYLFQGDINLNEQQISELSNNVVSKSRRKRQIMNAAVFWPGNTVYYYFNTDISDTMKQIARAGADFIQTRTCVKFVENSTAPNRVKIMNGGGCYSSVGMIGGVQDLSLGTSCDLVGTAAHELSHTLGVFHSQMRSDRDLHVTVDLTDVAPASQVNFVKYTPTTSTNLVEYEFGSFMHYSGRAFVSSGGVDSIIPKEPLMIYTMGGRIVTFMDIKMLNTHYKCSCPDPQLNCANGGYPNPANCAVCNCPYGFGGQLCNQKANYTCGSILTATANWQQETYSYGNESNRVASRPDFTYCNHWITAPTNKQIQFRIDSTYNTQCGYGCTFNGIEPKLKADQTMTQIRYCCDEFNGQIMNSEVNPLSIFSYNRYYITNYTFSYRYVDMAVPVCADLSDSETCTWLKENASKCSIYTPNQLKTMCAATLGYCGKSPTLPCADHFSASECQQYKSDGYCSVDNALIAEYSCAETCGYCAKPV